MYNHGAELATLLAEDLKGNFSLFVSHYQTRLYAFMLFRSGSPHEAEDIAQEAFIQAYYAMIDYPPARIQTLALQPWLFKIALNIFYKRLRRNKLQFVALDIEEDGPHTQIEADDISPEQLLTGKESQHELLSLLSTLPARYRDTIHLYYFAELSYREIADVLGQPIGTVKSNLHRGIQHLRKAMSMQEKGEKEWMQ